MAMGNVPYTMCKNGHEMVVGELIRFAWKKLSSEQ